MPEKISILKESGETLISNIVSVFMIPETGKRYIITTENAVDPHGLTVLHVSEIVDGNLQRVATDDEWSSIKTIMRAIISGNVGSYQYLPAIENIKAAGQYSRDISVSASASKQMIDNYANAPKTGSVDSNPVGGANVVPNNGVNQDNLNQQGVGTNNINNQPSIQPPIQPSSIFPEANNNVNDDNEVIPGIAEVQGGQSVPSEPVIANNQPVMQPNVANIPPVNGVMPNDSNLNTPVSVNGAVNQPIVQPVNPVENINSAPVNQTLNQTGPQPVITQTPVVENPVQQTMPVNNMGNVSSQVVPSTIASPTLDNLGTNPLPPISGVQVVEPTQVVPTSQIAQEVQESNVVEQTKTNSIPFAPNATLDEVVAGAQEMFMEGVKNLVQTIQEKVYRDLYAKEAELKAREEMLQQRENMLNSQGMNQVPNNMMQQGVAIQQNYAPLGMMPQGQGTIVGGPAPVINGPMIVSADNDK